MNTEVETFSKGRLSRRGTRRSIAMPICGTPVEEGLAAGRFRPELSGRGHAGADYS